MGASLVPTVALSYIFLLPLWAALSIHDIFFGDVTSCIYPILMPSFKDVPTELVDEIVKICGLRTTVWRRNVKRDLCTLRLISPLLRDLATPILFSHLTLDFQARRHPQSYGDSYNLKRCQQIIDALASGTTKVYEKTTSLELLPADLYSSKTVYNSYMRSSMKEKLQVAISALKNLRLVIFDTHELNPAEAYHFLQTIGIHAKKLRSCRFRMYTTIPPEVSLSHLSGLHVFELKWRWSQQESGLHTQLSDLFIRSPKLETLTLYPSKTNHYEGINVNFHECMGFNDIFAGLNESKHTISLKRMSLGKIDITRQDFRSAIRHFRHLQFLDITYTRSITLGDICKELQSWNIWLKGLVVEFFDDPFIHEYLMSYSGLEYLEIQGEVMNTGVEDLSEAVDRAYKQLISPHKATLTHLILGRRNIINEIEAWSTPTSDQVEEVVKCQKLKLLRIYWDDMIEGNCITTTWLEIAIQLPDLERLCVAPKTDVISKFIQKYYQQVKFIVEEWGLFDREEASYYYDTIGSVEEREEMERERANARRRIY